MHVRAFTFFATMLLLSALPAHAQQDESAPARRPLPGEAGTQCIDAENIISYHTVSDDLIRFELRDKDVMARLRKTCPQLHYHGYISYQPVNGQLCARFDDVVNRSGMPCRIESFTELPHTPGDETSDAGEGRP
ncbi:DUF6491 family protein [Kordiimonas aestuarii]|uniref:DUF6491 family protein n=1 Tax=Kordiimonas aestuarii TaxID=1005925 RepID=UPI0021D08BBD|nr:DUF6491 family protein [Kordiimonas aestuarii]